jgi:hypothetical protein
LEQRIGRVHRLGQSRPVHVIHMLTSDSIEERVWETMRLKKSLFAGVFDSPTGEISFAKLGRKTVLEAVKEIFASQPGRPKPIISPASSVPVRPPVAPMDTPVDSNAPQPVDPARAAGAGAPDASRVDGRESAGGIEEAVAGLMEAGVKFIESITNGEASGGGFGQILSGVFTRDTGTNRSVLSIPLPESLIRSASWRRSRAW